MIRSLTSAVSGLRSNQIRMDVIANNIANVNTTAFKSGRVLFSEMLSQNIRGNSTSQIGVQSINPAQIGLGTSVSCIDGMFGQGSVSPTNRVLDVAVDGNGFFVVGSVNDSGNVDNYFYTRDGAFYVDDAGFLVNSQGLYVLGASQDINVDVPDISAGDYQTIRLYDPDNFDLETIQINADGGVWVTRYDDTSKESGYVGRIGLDNYANPENLLRVGGNLYEVPLNGTVPDSTGWGNPNAAGLGKTVSGNLEMSNVDLSVEFSNMIITQRGYQANARVITTSDDMLRELIDLKR